jgi:hypothetical protein
MSFLGTIFKDIGHIVSDVVTLNVPHLIHDVGTTIHDVATPVVHEVAQILGGGTGSQREIHPALSQPTSEAHFLQQVQAVAYDPNFAPGLSGGTLPYDPASLLGELWGEQPQYLNPETVNRIGDFAWQTAMRETTPSVTWNPQTPSGGWEDLTSLASVASGWLE